MLAIIPCRENPAQTRIYKPAKFMRSEMQAVSCAATQAMPLPIKRRLDNFCRALSKAYARLQLATHSRSWYQLYEHASGCNLETCRYYACANIFPKKFKTSNPIGQNVRVARQLATLALPVYRSDPQLCWAEEDY